jgi:hypothetical protein
MQRFNTQSRAALQGVDLVDGLPLTRFGLFESFNKGLTDCFPSRLLVLILWVKIPTSSIARFVNEQLSGAAASNAS